MRCTCIGKRLTINSVLPANFKVKSTDDFSDLKEVKVTFNTPGPAGRGYDLILVNEAGESNAIGDFEITD